MDCVKCIEYRISECKKYTFCEQELREHDKEIWNEAIDKFLESCLKNKTVSKENPNILSFDIYRLRKITDNLKKRG